MLIARSYDGAIVPIQGISGFPRTGVPCTRTLLRTLVACPCPPLRRNVLSTLAPPAAARVFEPGAPRRRPTPAAGARCSDSSRTRRIVEFILVFILGAGGTLLLFGANFGLDMVHSQLDAQDISFPGEGQPRA